MKHELDTGYRTMCSTCLSTDRDIFLINNITQIYQIFRLIMYDFAGNKLGEALPEIEQFACWECLGLMKKFLKFKWKVHIAQKHLRVVTLSGLQKNMDHTYVSQSLSSLVMETNTVYDYSLESDKDQQHITLPVALCNIKSEQYDDIQEVVGDNSSLGLDDNILEAPEIKLENEPRIMSHNKVDSSNVKCDIFTHTIKSVMPHITIPPMSPPKSEPIVLQNAKPKQRLNVDPGYVTVYMTESEMLASREEEKRKVQYVNSVYKCKLCIVGFYSQQQVEDHFISMHKPKPGREACKVCHSYIDEKKLTYHVGNHYMRYNCSKCGHVDYNMKLAKLHTRSHLESQCRNVIKITEVGFNSGKTSKKKPETENKPPQPKLGDLRKLLSKTTIEGYQCLKCDMFFKTARARRTHVARCHGDGVHCDHCKKRFVNKTSLRVHLRLHEGPLPRQECPICHKMVRVIQLKYHIQRHKNNSRYACTDCNKMFSHLTTFQAHLKYSRAHASDQIFKYKCSICDKGYRLKSQLRDHTNYQHLGKTQHKCPICDKALATTFCVTKHVRRAHENVKESPREKLCQQCGKAFKTNKRLREHELIHTGERPLSCEICGYTFRQSASLYTHRKRVHNIRSSKKNVQLVED